MNNQLHDFSFKRVWLLIKADIVLFRATIINASLTVAAIMLLYNLFAPSATLEVTGHPTAFYLLLFVGGCFISSNAFRYLHESPKAYFFLMIPSSSLEKFLARWFLTGIGYAIFVLLFYSIFYWLIAAVTLLLTRQSYFVLIPFSAHIWHLILDYIVLQSVFLLGSIYFKKSVLLKTILAASCVVIFLMILAALLNKVLLHNLLLGNMFDFAEVMQMNSTAATIFYVLVSALIAPISWIATYLRLKEIEAS